MPSVFHFLIGTILFTIVTLPSESKVRDNFDNDKIEVVTQPPKIRKNFGISAWGLIFLIITVIMTGVAIYYTFLCYPILCKEERKYDRIELSTV